ncbi:MAG: YraN family protein [Crocinitomix sp.]|jgi:putative endonuclease|nr:YraN family protein [Crocinitomix sp.]
MADHIELGKEGEIIAVDYLQKKGFQILARNFRFKRAEVDIIVFKNDLLRIVEVKTRQSHYLAGPEITVTKKKQRAIVKVANAYIEDNTFIGETQFDIISIVLNKNGLSIEHLEDAFYPVL